MRLLVFGRDPQQADIVVNSQYVSGYHAELIQLDNGDMYLVDKSSNGTYINGSRITSGKEVKVNRGDNIIFADAALDWSQVEDLSLPPNVKTVKSIGSHYMNDIKIGGGLVSRFHATLRETKDGKWYICDYSKNGTSVNGQRLQKNRFVQLKAGDEIMCAGVRVENPIKSGSKVLRPILYSLAGCVLIALIVGGVMLLNGRPTTIYDKYNKSVVMILCSYHFEVECDGLPLDDIPDPDSWSYIRQTFTRNLSSKFIVQDDFLLPYDGSNSMPLTGTGFFVGNDGYIATNRHVVRPWLSSKTSTSSGSVTILDAARRYYKEKLQKLNDLGYTQANIYISEVKINGVLDYCAILPNGEFFDKDNSYNCTEIAASDDPEIDLAILKIKKNRFPDGCTYVPFNMIKSEKPKVTTGICTLGFPYSIAFQSDLDNKEISLSHVKGEVTKNNDDKYFVTSAKMAQGASGSPAFDEKDGKLVGVVFAVFGLNQEYSEIVYSYHLLDLLRKNKICE